MGCRVGSADVQFGVEVFLNDRENADTTEFCFTGGPARTDYPPVVHVDAQRARGCKQYVEI